MTLDKVVHQINVREIHYRLIKPKCAISLDKMSDLFKKQFTNFEEATLENASEMNFKVSDMIIRELLPDMVAD